MNMNPRWKRGVGFKDNSALESKVVREYKTTKKKNSKQSRQPTILLLL